MFTIFFIAFLISCTTTSAQTSNGDVEVEENGYRHDNLGSFTFPTGDARICLDMARRTKFPLKRFSSLPGIGWDNLRNEAAGQIFSYNYTKCRATEDGRYLIPDAVFTIPVKSSQVETFAEIYESWNNVTSITSRSINVDANLGIGSYGVSGSFSSEHVRVKRKQIRDNSVATRVQLRYLRYKARLLPGSALHPVFRSRLLSIAADLNQNMTQNAYYKAQLLIREYGTHVLTGVIAGAGLVKTDFLTRSYIASHAHDKRVVTASASASFGDVFKMSSSFKQSSNVNEDRNYKKSMTYSYVTTHGGPIFRPYNMTVTQWVNGVDSEMVPLDRSGDPLFYLITTEMFPDLPVSVVEMMEGAIREAVIQYYEMNTIRGCTKLGSPNFSFSANIDDGSCVKTANNLTFGGVYQTCWVSGSYLYSNPCNGMTQVNPLTKGKSCPSDYSPVLLHSGDKLGRRESSTSCRRCGFLWLKKCCDTTYYQARGRYSTYWCAASGPVTKYSGYVFGGTYSRLSSNLITKTKSCPSSVFYPLRILQEHYICVSDDYELAQPHAVPFGGFTSCSIGNPFALSGSSKTKLETFIQESSRWPKVCPEGFSQHLTAVDDGCEIRYCIKTGALADPDLRAIRRPPFSSKPETIPPTDVLTVVDSDSSIQDGRMIVPQDVHDEELEEKMVAPADTSVLQIGERSGAAWHLPSFLMPAITMAGLMWTQFRV